MGKGHMRKHQQEKSTTATNRLVKIVCGCGAVCDRPEYDGATWADDPYTKHSTTIEHEDSKSYPEASFGDRWIYDLCPSCWESLKDWLHERGHEAHRVEIDF